jgi:N-acetyl-gamma-glutamyl-phosphate reductase/acetylglutamate kinase
MRIADLPEKQAQRYLQALQSFKPHRQLMIKVGGGLLEDEAAVLELAEALAELAKHDVHTLLIHGGGTQLSKAIIENLHINPHFKKGIRYTDEPTLELAKSIFSKITDHLVQVFNDNGIKAITLPSTQLFNAKRDPALGLSGTEVTGVKTDTIIDAMKQYPVLVLNSLASDEASGGALNINSDTIFRALATELKPHRMISLTPTGGVLKSIEGSDARELISGINIRDIDALIDDGIVSGGMELKLRELAAVLGKLEIGSAISITKPSDLLLELLTDQGSGTFICKGQKIIKTHDIADLYPALSALIVEVFSKSLPAGYQKQAFEKIYFTGDRLAFGIITKLSNGAPYLDKLAVSPQLQGRGVGESLWYCIVKDYPVIVWRSHATNRYATWYHRHADIMKRQGEWIIFGRGVDFQALETLAQEIPAIPAMR